MHTLSTLLVTLGVFLCAVPLSYAKVTIAPGTPITLGSVPQGAQRVSMLSLKISASCGEKALLSSLTFSHGALGNAQDISKVYMMSGTKRVSRAVAVPVRGSVIIPVSRLFIPACGSTELTLMADIASTAAASGEHSFTLESGEMSDGTTVYIWQSITSSEAAVTSQGTPGVVTAELLPALRPIIYGPKQGIVRISLTGIGGKDQRVTAITLQNNGSASNGDLKNFYLEDTKGDSVSSILPQMDGRTIRIELNPSFVLYGRDLRLLTLRADVLASRRKTIRLEIEEPSDVEALEVRIR